MKVKCESEVAQLCLTLSDPIDCSLPGSSVHGVFQARVLEWGAIAFSDCCAKHFSNFPILSWILTLILQGRYHNSCSQKKPPLKDWMIVSCFYRAEESCEPKLEFEPNLSDSEKPVLNHSITHRRKEGQNVPFKQWEAQLDWRLKYLNIRRKRHTGKKNGEKFEKTPNVSLRVLACFVLQNQFGKVDTRKIACMFPLKEPLNTNTNMKERTNRESVAGVFSYNNK